MRGLPVALAVLLVVYCADDASAWQPAGWVWHNWPHQYSLEQEGWFYLHEGQDLWGLNLASASWSRLRDMEPGWLYFAWPYGYAAGEPAWYWLNEANTLWCLSYSSLQWSLYGQLEIPAGMVLIPAGAFQMGDSLGDSLGEGASDERPVHTVYVSAFYMAQHEVTLALWDDVYLWARTNGYEDLPGGRGKGAQHPAHSVTWFDVVKWCNARSQKERRTPCYTVGGQTYKTGEASPNCNWSANGYRLPTEAEWEKAARGQAVGRRFSWGDSDLVQHVRANYWSTNEYAYDTSPTRGYHPAYDEGAMPYTSPVGSFSPNGYSLFDITGNVSEWCWDWYGEDYYAKSPGTDPRGPASGYSRVYRGGSWQDWANSCRVAERMSTPRDSYNDLGLRLAVSAP